MDNFREKIRGGFRKKVIREGTGYLYGRKQYPTKRGSNKGIRSFPLNPSLKRTGPPVKLKLVSFIRVRNLGERKRPPHQHYCVGWEVVDTSVSYGALEYKVVLNTI